MFVVGALAVTAAAHTFVASDQQRIDTLQGQLTQTLAQQQDLQLSRAELESPVRVLAIAERQLGMVSPESVSYLPPVDPGPSVSQAGADGGQGSLGRSRGGSEGRTGQVRQVSQVDHRHPLPSRHERGRRSPGPDRPATTPPTG